MQPVKNRYNFLQIVREHEVALAPVAPACSTVQPGNSVGFFTVLSETLVSSMMT